MQNTKPKTYCVTIVMKRLLQSNEKTIIQSNENTVVVYGEKTVFQLDEKKALQSDVGYFCALSMSVSQSQLSF